MVENKKENCFLQLIINGKLQLIIVRRIDK